MVRPISPYLSIYRPQVGSLFSILQRISGILLALLFLFFFFLLYIKEFVVSFYAGYYMLFTCVKSSYFMLTSGTFILGTCLFFMIMLLVYHICFSIRYLYWFLTGGTSLEYGLNLATLDASTYTCCFIVCLNSLLLWLVL